MKGRQHHRWVVATVALVCGALAATVVLWWPRTTVVRVEQQPPAVVYPDGGRHVAVLRHVRAPITALRSTGSGPSPVDHYEVVLGRDPSGDHGHRIRFDATGMDPDDLTVEWTADGATLAYRSGHRIFVPATFFTGGR